MFLGCPRHLQYHTSVFWLYTMDHGNFWVVYALYHMTRSWGSNIMTSMKSFNPNLPAHYATCLQ